MADEHRTCGCGAPAAHRCDGCGDPLCDDHALGPLQPRPRHFRFRSFADLLRDYPVEHALDEARFWRVRAAVAAQCRPGVRCAACWERAFDAAVAATATTSATTARAAGTVAGAVAGAVDGDDVPDVATVTTDELLAAWRRTGKPSTIDDDSVGSSRFRAAKGWRVGTLHEDRYARDGEGTVRVQVGPVYLLANGDVWTRGRRLDVVAGCPASWLPTGAAGGVDTLATPDGDGASVTRPGTLAAARAEAEETLRRNGWP